jgi:tRNA nucleotidyltransferase (CCA-adding enzyme)
MNATEIIKRLTANGSEAYVIGGAVRDKLMGLPAKDEDVVTKARPSEIIKLFRDRKVSEVGKSFGVVLIDGIEVATYRKDRYEGLSDKKVEITYADTLHEDVARRDFTINTIAWNPITNEIIDHLNGRADINDKKIRFVNNADERIVEDPNRILRAIRFAARFNFSIDGETWAALKKHGNYVKEYVAKERIQKEILEAMKIKHASLFFRLLHDLDILKNILPSMEACYVHPHGKYHREDIFDHLMISGDHISTKYPILKLATYLHDIGKPAVYEDDHFIDHEVVGANLVSQQLCNLGFSKDVIHYISSVTRLHMRSHLKTPTPKSVRRFLFKLEESGIPFIDMVRLCNADLAGSDRAAGGEDEDRYEKLYNLIKMIHTELERPAPVHSLHKLAVNGNDVT